MDVFAALPTKNGFRHADHGLPPKRTDVVGSYLSDIPARGESSSEYFPSGEPSSVPHHSDATFEQVKAIIKHHQQFVLVRRKLKETMKISNLVKYSFYNIILPVSLYQISMTTDIRPLTQLIAQVSIFVALVTR